jgi:hypothetical protein
MWNDTALEQLFHLFHATLHNQQSSLFASLKVGWGNNKLACFFYELLQTALEASGKVTLNEGRNHCVSNYGIRRCISNELFHSEAQFNTDSALFHSQRNENPVVQAFVPKRPGVGDSNRE